MRLVIDIPDQMYQKIKETNMVISGRRSGKRFDYTLFNAVNTGTPLPKGHGKLKDVDALLEKQYRIDDSATLSTRDVVNVEDVEDALTVIEADKIESEGDE